MSWFILAHLISTLLAFIGLGRRPENDKDLEILILRHQLNIVARKQQKPIEPTRTEKLILAVLVHKLKRVGTSFVKSNERAGRRGSQWQNLQKSAT